MIKLSTLHADSFQFAVELLSEFGPNVRTQNFGVAIAVLMHRSGNHASPLPRLINSPESGALISTAHLQQNVCDALNWKEKKFLPSPESGQIYKPFTKNFKPTSSGANNNWRNSFDLQAGLSCDAPYDEEFLRNSDFLGEPRFDCLFRDAETGICGSPAGLTTRTRTCFNPDKRPGRPPGPETKAKPVPKLLTRGLSENGAEGYWVIEPTREVLIDLLGNPKIRVPLYPFMVAIYSGNPALMKSRPWITREQFQKDLWLDDDRFVCIFDPNPLSELNQKFLTQCQTLASAIEVDEPHIAEIKPENLEPKNDQILKDSPLFYIAESKIIAKEHPLVSAKLYVAARELPIFKIKSEREPDPIERLRLLEKASRGHARALDNLACQLFSFGFAPQEQEGGFDLYVDCGTIGHLFEIKTWRPENLKAQVRSGISQLYEYRWRNRKFLNKDTKLYIVLDRKPLDVELEWLWEYLIKDRFIIPCWIESEQLTTFANCSEHIQWMKEYSTGA